MEFVLELTSLLLSGLLGGTEHKENKRKQTEERLRGDRPVFTLFDTMLTPPLAAVLSSLVLWYQ